MKTKIHVVKIIADCTLPAFCVALLGCQNIMESAGTASPVTESPVSGRVTIPNANILKLRLTNVQSNGISNLEDPADYHNPVVDWVFWGYTSAQSVTRKANVSATIGNFTTIPAGIPVQRFTSPASPRKFGWTLGTPVSSASNVTSSVYTTGAGRGFRLAVKTNPRSRDFRLFTGVYRARGKLKLSMSDGSSPAVTSESPENRTGTTYVEHVISYSATNTSAVLYIEWTMAADFGNGRVMLQAANTWQDNDSPVAQTCGQADYGDGFPPSQNCETVYGTWGPNLRFSALGTAYDPDYSIVRAEYLDLDVPGSDITLNPGGPYDYTWTPFKGEYKKYQLEVMDNHHDVQRSGIVRFISLWRADFIPEGSAYLVPDADPAGVIIPLPDQGYLGAINQFAFGTLVLKIDHPFVSDLRVYLVNPQGGYQALVLNQGGSTDNIELVFRTEGGQPVSNLANLSPFQDVQPVEPFSVHFGAPASGVWKLHIIDDYPQDIGWARVATFYMSAK